MPLNFVQNPAELDQQLAEFGQLLADVGQLLADVGATLVSSANIARNLSDFGKMATIGETLVQIGQRLW